jgi:ribonuclease P protein component
MATFRPLEHVRRRADFEQVYEAGAKVNGRYMTMFVAPNSVGTARLGIAATRRLGGAVVRNRAKRLTRELFRHQKPAASLDVIVVPRREFLDAPYSNLEREFGALLERSARTPRGGHSRRPARAGGPRRDSRV